MPPFIKSGDSAVAVLLLQSAVSHAIEAGFIRPARVINGPDAAPHDEEFMWGQIAAKAGLQNQQRF
jgi:hypothetical protein